MAEKIEDKTEEKPETEEKPSYMTADDYNKAQSAWRTRLEKSFTKTLDERLAALSESMKPKDEPAPAPEAKKGPDPEVLALRKRLDEAEKARKSEQEAREAERQARLRDEEDAALRRALRTAGIDDEDLLDGAAALHLRRNNVARDEAGRVCYRAKDKYNEEKLVPIEEGIKEWAASSSGKKYVPASGVEGSGSKPRSGSRPGAGGKNSKMDAVNALARLSGVRFQKE
jgi:hypothetical protein